MYVGRSYVLIGEHFERGGARKEVQDEGWESV